MPEQGSHAWPRNGHTHSHTCALARQLPSAAPGITSVQSKVVLRTQHLPGDHTQTTSHSLTAHGDAITKCLKKNRLERDDERCWCQLHWGIKDRPLTRVRSWGGTIKTRVLQSNRTGNTGYCEHITEGNRKLSYKSKQPRTTSTEINAHTVTSNTDKSHAGLVQSTCLKKSMYKIVLCKHGEVNV